jgi:hypothetical protein
MYRGRKLGYALFAGFTATAEDVMQAASAEAAQAVIVNAT